MPKSFFWNTQHFYLNNVNTNGDDSITIVLSISFVIWNIYYQQ
jgi:hypothetical protein